MKNLLSFLIFVSLSNSMYSGIEEDTINQIINLFKKIITSEYQAEVSNAERNLLKGRLRLAINHLLTAGIDLKSGELIVHLEDARESYAKGKSDRIILSLIVKDLLEGNKNKQFMDEANLEIFNKAQQQMESTNLK